MTHRRNPDRRQLVGGLAGAAALAALSPLGLRAQTGWPNKTIRIVCGYPAGGLTDALARANADYLGQKLGQSVVVENKSGASGMLAGAEVARAAPDGHTLWFTITGTLNQNRVLFKKMPYDPDKDFAYVSGFHAGHLPLAVNASSPIRNMRDVIELGKKQQLTLGNYSAGSLPHMVAQQLSKHYGIKIEPVPYKGEAPMWLDLASGQINMAMGSILAMTPHLQSGKVRPIAVPTHTRSVLLPEVPTFVEQGFAEPVFTIEGWLGLLAPAGTPREIVQRLSDLVQEAADTPRVRQLNKQFGLNAKPWTAAEFEKLDREIKPRWVELARELNLSLD